MTLPTRHIFDGTNWVDAPSDASHYKYWGGSAWVVPNDIKYWDGDTWESLFGKVEVPLPPGQIGSSSITLQETLAATSNSANSLSIPYSASANDFLVLVVAQQSNLAGGLFQPVSGWTKQGEQRAGTAADTIAVYTRAVTADESATVVPLSANTANMTAHLRRYRGVSTSNPLDVPVVFLSGATGLTGQAPAAAPTRGDVVLVPCYSVPSTANTVLHDADWGDPSGFLHKLTTCPTTSVNNAALATYDGQTPGTGTQGPFTASIPQSRPWALATVALRPAV